MESAVAPSSKQMRCVRPSPVTVSPPSVRLIYTDPHGETEAAAAAKHELGLSSRGRVEAQKANSSLSLI